MRSELCHKGTNYWILFYINQIESFKILNKTNFLFKNLVDIWTELIIISKEILLSQKIELCN